MPTSKIEKLAVAERHVRELAIAERHVRDGRRVLQRQCDLIDRLRNLGHSTAQSEMLLGAFQRSQAIFENDLARLLVEHLPAR